MIGQFCCRIRIQQCQKTTRITLSLTGSEIFCRPILFVFSLKIIHGQNSKEIDYQFWQHLEHSYDLFEFSNFFGLSVRCRHLIHFNIFIHVCIHVFSLPDIRAVRWSLLLCILMSLLMTSFGDIKSNSFHVSKCSFSVPLAETYWKLTFVRIENTKY